MTDRTFTMDTGQVVPVFIDDAAFRQWLDDRERLKGHYPDRPPDIDTPTMRSWSPHPFEVGYLAGAADRSSVVGEPYYTQSAVWGGMQIKRLVARTEDGGFDEAFVMESSLGRDELGSKKYSDEEQFALGAEAFEVMVAETTAQLGAPPDEVKITTPEDFAEMERVAKEVKQKIADWYARQGVTQ